MGKLSLILLFFLYTTSTLIQNQHVPDLTKKEDLKALGRGRIFNKDKSSLVDIQLFEIKEILIVYIKNESLHDLEIEKIERIEFPDSFWGAIKIEFIKNKPKISPIKNQNL